MINDFNALGARLARDLMAVGDENGDKACRMEYKGGIYPNNETNLGGMCEAALAGFFAARLRDYLDASIAEQEAEIARLREDAERYRWLRDQHTYNGARDSVARWYVQAGCEPVPCDPGALDSEIDAARKEQP